MLLPVVNFSANAVYIIDYILRICVTKKTAAPSTSKQPLTEEDRWLEGVFDADEEILKRVRNLAYIGLKRSEIAAVLGVRQQTFDSQLKRLPHLREAVENGRARGIAKVAGIAFEMASSGKDKDMTRFFLRAQAGWSETIGVEHSGQTEIVFSTKIGTDGIIRTEENSEVVIDADTIDKLT